MAVSASSGLLCALVLCVCITGIAGDYCEYDHNEYVTTTYCAWGCCETDCCDLDIGTGAKVGIVVGSIVGVVVLVVLAVFLRRFYLNRRMTVVRANPCYVIPTSTSTNFGVQSPGAALVLAPPPYPGTKAQASGFDNSSYA